MTKAKTNYNYSSNNYNNKKILFYILLTSIISTLVLTNYLILTKALFIYNTIAITLIIITIAIIYEQKYKSFYMNPIEISEVKNETNQIIRIIKNSHNKDKLPDKYFNKYDYKTKKNIQNEFDKKSNYTIDFITKINANTYHINISTYKSKKSNNKNILKYLFNIYSHKLALQKEKNKYKIIYFK